MLTSRGSTYAHRYYPQTKVAMVTGRLGNGFKSLIEGAKVSYDAEQGPKGTAAKMRSIGL
jgi:hypothetical protein